MNFNFILLWTDLFVYILVVAIILFFLYARRQEHLREPWRSVGHDKLGMIALVILLTFGLIGFLDSIHFQSPTYNDNQVVSVLDKLLEPLPFEYEKTYSEPLATHLYTNSMIKIPNDGEAETKQRLLYGGAHLNNLDQKDSDIKFTILLALLQSLALFTLLSSALIWHLSRKHHLSFSQECKAIIFGKTFIAWREILLTFLVILIIFWIIKDLASHYHLLGTDKVGRDVLYEAIKSIRTGLLIGTLTTLVMLPFALLFGTTAGYFGGFIDDLIQYIYTTLSSIPGVLLISAAILSLQVYFSNHPELFTTLAERADARLLALCLILGITSWTGLCRLLRAETLKIREIDYVKAAHAMGVGNTKIITRHVLPNVMHIILITVVLDFSTLVLAEAVLSYVGVGVDPTTLSWGNMINSARLELAREPMVWWPLVAAFIFMFTLVLAANFFADTVRDAFDPRLKGSNQ